VSAPKKVEVQRSPDFALSLDPTAGILDEKECSAYTEIG
jgi:hypothetical protein